jgi:hypothetical protein
VLELTASKAGHLLSQFLYVADDDGILQALLINSR